MKPFDWNEQKDALLKTTRGVSFNDAARAIQSDDLLENIMHPDQKKYPGQKILI